MPNRALAHLPVLILHACLAGHFICGAAAFTPLAAQTAADAPGEGRPIIRNYDHRDFGAEVQNWDVLQDENGVMYFANNGGVLEFDGRSWRLIELPARVAAHYLAVGSRGAGRVYVGAPGDVGYLDADDAGQLQFRSLLPADARQDRSFTAISRPVVTRSGLYFHLKNSVCRWTAGELRCRETSAPLSGIFAVRDKAYVHQQGAGLMQIVDSSLRPVAGGERFADQEITVLLPYTVAGVERLLVGTRQFGLYLHDGFSFQPLGPGIRDRAGQDQLLAGTLLRDSSLALATRLRGVLIVDAQGHVRQQIDRSAGLLADHAHGVWPDRQGGLWVALQHGISRVELNSPFTLFDEGSGLEREWRDVVRHQGILYVRGYKGLFASTGLDVTRSPATNIGPAPPAFRRIAALEPPVWSLLDVGHSLLASSRDGVYAIRDGRVRRIATYASMPMALYRSRRNPRRVYVGLAEGLASLRHEDGGWYDEGRIDGIDETVTSIGETPGGVLWLVSQWQRAIRLHHAGPREQAGVPDTRPGPAHVHRFGPEALTGRIAVREIAGRPVFLTESGILEFDETSRAFVPVPGLAVLAQNGRRSFSSIAEDPHGNVWVSSRKPGGVDFLWKQPDGSYVVDNAGLRQMPVWSIYPDPQGGLVWFSTPDYLLRYDPAVPGGAAGGFRTLIRKITINRERVVHGGAMPRSGAPRSGQESPRLPSSTSALDFEFAATGYDDAERNEFQSYLEGFDRTWSAWGNDASRTYTNLPQGRYRFRARARDVRGDIGEEAVFAFSVLPPWYLSTGAYAAYLLCLCGGILGARRIGHRRSRLKLEREREHMELEKLREIDRLKSRFFADVSHEFRTPISLILGPVGQMLEETTAPDARQKLELVRRHAEYLMRLISQMLDLSKLESRKLPLRVGPGDLARELGTIVAPFANLAENQGISLRLEASVGSGGAAAPAYFDRDVLEKTINNLLANACKVTPPGGTITVTLDRCRQPSAGGPDDEVAEIVVSDTGSGISAEHLPHVFDRFYQAGSIRIRDGFGIGLALVKELVELHRGVVTVASEAGRGTAFMVQLPVGRGHFRAEEIVGAPAVTHVANHDRPGRTAPGVPAVATAGSGEHRLDTTVLVVEDHKELRGFLREQLEPHYRVVEAGDGSAGLERARSFLPGLVLSDVMMDGMDGYELCRALKTNLRTAHIPVVLLTARAGREDHILGLETGADCFMVKPFDPGELLAQIRNLVEQRRLLRHRFSGSVILKPSEMAVVPADEVFLGRILAAVEAHLEDPDFDVEQLGQAVGLSRSQLHRKVRSLTQQPPTILIRSIRLQRSAALLAGRAGGVAEIAYSVGFSSQSYFAKCFREQFGCSPKEYRESVHASSDGRLPAHG